MDGWMDGCVDVCVCVCVVHGWKTQTSGALNALSMPLDKVVRHLLPLCWRRLGVLCEAKNRYSPEHKTKAANKAGARTQMRHAHTYAYH